MSKFSILSVVIVSLMLQTLKTYTEIPDNCVCAAKDKEFGEWNRAFVARTDNKTKVHTLQHIILL